MTRPRGAPCRPLRPGAAAEWPAAVPWALHVMLQVLLANSHASACAHACAYRRMLATKPALRTQTNRVLSASDVRNIMGHAMRAGHVAPGVPGGPSCSGNGSAIAQLREQQPRLAGVPEQAEFADILAPGAPAQQLGQGQSTAAETELEVVTLSETWLVLEQTLREVRARPYFSSLLSQLTGMNYSLPRLAKCNYPALDKQQSECGCSVHAAPGLEKSPIDLQVASSQPLLLLATCHCDPAELPSALLAFLSSSSSTEDGALPDNIVPFTEDLPQAPGPVADVALDMQQALAGAH